jgi:hypothetical protein
MWNAIVGFVRGLFGGKGAIQIGAGKEVQNQSVTGSTAGDNSPVISAGGNVLHNVQFHVNAPQPRPAEEEPFADLDPPVRKFLCDLAEALVESPLLRIMIVLDRKTIEYTWPGPHLKLSEDEMPDIRDIVGILVSHGLLIEEREDFAYRISERLAGMLKKKSLALNKYKIHNALLTLMRKGAVICPWPELFPEVDRGALMGAIALLREEGLADIKVGEGYAVADTGKAPTIEEIMNSPPSFKGVLTDKGIRAVDENKDNVVEQFLKNKGK